MLELLDAFLDIWLDMAPWLLVGFVVAFLCSYALNEHWMRRHLGGSGWLPIVKASLFGLPLPICSCGVLLVGLAMRKNGARKAPVCAFLASTPQSGTDALLVSWPLLGPVLTLGRFLCAMASGLVSGALVRWFGIAQPPPQETEDLKGDCAALCACHHHDSDHPHHEGEAHHHEFADRRTRLREAARYAFVHLPGEVAPFLFLGVLCAALLGHFLPEGLLQGLPRAAAYALAILIGIPSYACSLAIVPVAAVLIAQGLPPGAAFILMTCAPTVNVASLLILNREFGWRTVLSFLAGIVLVALIFGAAIDCLSPAALALPPFSTTEAHAHAHDHAPAFFALVPVALLLLHGFVRTHLGHRHG